MIIRMTMVILKSPPVMLFSVKCSPDYQVRMRSIYIVISSLLGFLQEIPWKIFSSCFLTSNKDVVAVFIRTMSWNTVMDFCQIKEILLLYYKVCDEASPFRDCNPSAEIQIRPSFRAVATSRVLKCYVNFEYCAKDKRLGLGMQKLCPSASTTHQFPFPFIGFIPILYVTQFWLNQYISIWLSPFLYGHAGSLGDFQFRLNSNAILVKVLNCSFFRISSTVSFLYWQGGSGP